ncbi:unnamed protein product [Fraxinus pennsylvanica]|uniref:Uncharacterized protein n=1 Tax=Fraxinus pennsylvanica TaxID=56036 RepID=A0AAD1YXN3_9LAMI|nr:unnamed protein product [Fraxinus pennsylvanica]
MTISPAFFSSLLNVSTSKIPNSDTPFTKIKYASRRRTHSIHFHPIRSVADSISTVDNQLAAASSSAPSSLATTTNSVRIMVPLKVYHVPKVPEYELTGKDGCGEVLCWGS